MKQRRIDSQRQMSLGFRYYRASCLTLSPHAGRKTWRDVLAPRKRLRAFGGASRMASCQPSSAMANRTVETPRRQATPRSCACGYIGGRGRNGPASQGRRNDVAASANLALLGALAFSRFCCHSRTLRFWHPPMKQRRINSQRPRIDASGIHPPPRIALHAAGAAGGFEGSDGADGLAGAFN
jgi:hypothetical protein